MKYIVIALGAGLGGSLRFWISNIAHRFLPVYFPIGTLAVNIIGSIILGILMFGYDEKEAINPMLKLFIGVGFCGGLTTFSTFSFETFTLIKQSQFSFAGLNVFLNVMLTTLGIYIGYILTR